MKTKPAPTFLRTSVTQRIVFPSKPDAATCRALRMAGFSWNSVFWFRTDSVTTTLKPAEVAKLITPPQPEQATA